MPDYYSSIGEAVGAAKRHNIRLAHPDVVPSSRRPLQVRHLPGAAADPYSIPGMIARLTEDASPAEVAAFMEELNGALPELTELVAAAADWTRARLAFDNPYLTPASPPSTRWSPRPALRPPP
ncbi:hypothetical protein [Streptomyces bauhiniae]|uniref:hypothetical protein n=1 Tax=Streptomyces bauhiniae TaxID=2340725 RepID=UPI0036584BEE